MISLSVIQPPAGYLSCTGDVKPYSRTKLMSSQEGYLPIFDVCRAVPMKGAFYSGSRGRSGSGDGGSRGGEVLSTEGKVQWAHPKAQWTRRHRTKTRVAGSSAPLAAIGRW